MTIVFYNGRLIPEEEACIPIYDRGFLFGDAIFTTMKVVDGHVRCLEAHIKRLKYQAQLIRLELPVIELSIIEALIQHNFADRGIWRLKIIVTSANSSTLDLSNRPYGSFLMTIQPYELPKDDEVRLAIYPDPICRPSSPIKSLAYLDRLYVQDFARKHECHDALVLGANSEILETAYSNFFWRLDDQLFVPSSHLPFLQGIALEHVKQAVCNLGMTVQEVSILWPDLPTGVQCFICNALTDIRSVVSIERYCFQRDFHFENLLKTAYEIIVCKA